MKKNYFYALLGAIALTGAVGLTSCSTENDVADVNPNYDPQTGKVTTQFVLNIASNEMPSTRQNATTVQKNNNFRGMMDAWLVGLKTGKESSFLAPLTATGQQGLTVKQAYNLGELYGNGSVKNDPNDEGDNKTNANKSSHRVVELSLPTGTDAMLVYGRAIPATPADDEENGKVTYPATTVFSTTPLNFENVKFSLVSRLGEKESDAYKAYVKTLKVAQTILNRIMLSQVAENNMENPYESPSANSTYTQHDVLPALTWRYYGTLTSEQIAALGATAPLQQNLAKAYQAIQTTYSTGDIHSGSAANVCNVVKDVYAIAKSVVNAIPTNDGELNGQRLAEDIKLRIEKYFTNPDGVISFKSIGSASDPDTPMGSLIANTTLQESDFTGVTSTNLQGFPSVFGVPDGVAQLTFTAGLTLSGNDNKTITNGFLYKELDNDASLINLSATLNPSKYMYPAELLYFDNSLLYVSDSEKDPDDYPEGYNTWDNYTWSTDWVIGAVTSATRSVAVKNNINYGVSMLQTNVIVDANATEFTDAHDASENISYSKEDVKKLKLNGVLIGGQYKEVGWNYLSTGNGDNTDFIIYDNKIADPNILTSATPNYTLVFDNYAGENQSDVLVALEFINETDKDIYGKGGMIPKDATFYLVGKLAIASKTISDWPTYYAVPPYTDAGATNQVPRVFVQDFMTKATFKIGPESLKHAYTTVPDLRSSQTSLGLSVDLNWREGIDFGEVVLGE